MTWLELRDRQCDLVISDLEDKGYKRTEIGAAIDAAKLDWEGGWWETQPLSTSIQQVIDAIPAAKEAKKR